MSDFQKKKKLFDNIAKKEIIAIRSENRFTVFFIVDDDFVGVGVESDEPNIKMDFVDFMIPIPVLVNH